MADEIKVQAASSKRIALFIDGTWNVQTNNTNVWRMYSLCARTGVDNIEQAKFYTKGVGTTFGEKVRGGWFGAGIKELIMSAYEWLIEHYNEGDEIFVFGFSRGAYAARSLAGFVSLCGIIKPGSPIGVGELFDRYQKGEKARSIYKLQEMQAASKLQDLVLIERWMLKYSRPSEIIMVGVWDTVGALKGQKGYFETGLRVPVQNAFHALAIDEHRKTFLPTLYTVNTPLNGKVKREIANVEQRWFAGAHANVGGGYESDLLPQPPLRWLMLKASALGLTFRETIESDDELYGAVVRDSLKEFARGWYQKIAGTYFREIGAKPVIAGSRQSVNVHETIDATVFERWRRDPKYRPANLVTWQAATHAQMENIRTSVRADDPNQPVPD